MFPVPDELNFSFKDEVLKEDICRAGYNPARKPIITANPVRVRATIHGSKMDRLNARPVAMLNQGSNITISSSANNMEITLIIIDSTKNCRINFFLEDPSMLRMIVSCARKIEREVDKLIKLIPAMQMMNILIRLNM
jgi:hypothetical protein